MSYSDENLLEINCEECPVGSCLPASPDISPICKNCPLFADREFDTLRLKTKYLVKEYNSNMKLQYIAPFFVDIRIKTVSGNYAIVKEYLLKTGAKVTIYQETVGSGYIYGLSLPDNDVNFEEIRILYEKVNEFEETGKTDNALIRRWFLNFGVLEHLLFDENVLEVNINPPGYTTPLRVVHAEFDECVSNVYPSEDALNYLATRLKINTGRPLNKAQPQLDGEIVIENQRARIAAVANPFSIYGMAYSVRKHREKPWTLPLFMENKTTNYWFAGIMGLAITHGRTFLVAGPRGSGKTALLGSLILELLPKYRIITIEDTQELPIDAYKDFGYDLLPLKVRSALLEKGFEYPFDSGLRTSLRLGDSCLIVGEIRSKEACVLYEAMRVGAMSNVVAGTIHGDSPYGVFDRVVNDLGVPPGSFKVTDLIVIVNQIKSPTASKRKRRVLQVTEVLKDWVTEPKFQDLLVYDPKKDELVPTPELLQGKSLFIQNILKVTQGYTSYDDVLNDVILRGWAKEKYIEVAGKNFDLYEGKHTVLANQLFVRLFEKINPLSSKEAEKKFKIMYINSLKHLVQAYHAYGNDGADKIKQNLFEAIGKI